MKSKMVMFVVKAFVILTLVRVIYAQDAENENMEHKQEEPEVSLVHDSNITAMMPNFSATVYDIAKNISYSKGPFMEAKDKDSEEPGNLQLRRSLIRKASITSEMDVLKQLLEHFVNDGEDKVTILKQMVDLVRQYNVGMDFVKMKGLHVLVEHLSSPNEMIVSSVLSVLGAAMQGNPVVQKTAFQLNVDGHLTRLFSGHALHLYPSILFALSSYLRNAPEAQERFLVNDGLSILSEILKNILIATDTKLKVINLLSDLCMEHQSALENLTGDQEKVSALQRLFALEINKADICYSIPPLLDMEDFDSHYKVISAMNALHPVCEEAFSNVDIIYRLADLYGRYRRGKSDLSPIYPFIDLELRLMLNYELLSLQKKIVSTIDETKIKTFEQLEENYESDFAKEEL